MEVLGVPEPSPEELEEVKRQINIEGKAVDISINSFGVEIDGKKLEKIIKDVVNLGENAEYGDKIEFRGDIKLIIEEGDNGINADSDFKFKKEDDE